MPVMFCYIDPFVMNQSVVELTPEDQKVLYSGQLDEVCNYIAQEYMNNKYDKVVLKGTLAESVADQIRAYSIMSYGYNDIEIEVI